MAACVIIPSLPASYILSPAILPLSKHGLHILAVTKTLGIVACSQGNQKLPRCIGIILSRSKDPDQPTRIQWKVTKVWNTAHLSLHHVEANTLTFPDHFPHEPRKKKTRTFH